MKLTQSQIRILILEQLSQMVNPEGGDGIDPYINIDIYDKNKDGFLSPPEERELQDAINKKKATQSKQKSVTLNSDKFDSKTLYQIAEIVSFIDPTGIASWPDLYKRNEEYESNPTLSNGVKLGLAWIGVIPLIGKGTKLIKLANWLSSIKKSSLNPIKKGALDTTIEAGKSLLKSSSRITDIVSRNDLNKFFKQGLDNYPDQLKSFLKAFNIDSKNLPEILKKLTDKIYDALQMIDNRKLLEKWHNQMYYLGKVVDKIIVDGMDRSGFSTVLDLTGEIASKSYDQVMKNLKVNENNIVVSRKTLERMIHESLSEDRHNPNKLKLHDAKVGNIPIKIQICDELEDRKKGLMFRHSIPKDEGMLFIHDAPVEASYYMKNTYIPLTIAFADEDGVIFQMEDMFPGDLTSKVSIQPALYALEMNKGWFDRNGIVIGDNIDF